MKCDHFLILGHIDALNYTQGHNNYLIISEESFIVSVTSTYFVDKSFFLIFPFCFNSVHVSAINLEPNVKFKMRGQDLARCFII
jgi:hypothetical protein